MSFAGKVLTVGVLAKALLMTAIVTVVGATTFGQSIILVIVSATATGVFALLVVLIQVKSEAELHKRIDAIEAKGAEIAEQTTAIKQETSGIAQSVKRNGESE